MKLSPLEVDRELYKLYMKHDRYTGNWFPAPREVDRYLYSYIVLTMTMNAHFRPLAR